MLEFERGPKLQVTFRHFNTAPLTFSNFLSQKRRLTLLEPSTLVIIAKDKDLASFECRQGKVWSVIISPIYLFNSAIDCTMLK